MKLTASVSNRSALVANLYAANERAQFRYRDAVIRFGMAVHETAQQLAPKDTGFMAEHIRENYSEGGLRVTVGYYEQDFTSRGFFPYYMVQEFGSVNQPGQPHIGPSYRIHAPGFLAEISDITRRAYSQRG